jgi:hydrogenase nickel incorporation protein HypB
MQALTYPTIFNSADVAVIAKADLADAIELEEAAVRRNIHAARPGMEVIKVSSKTKEGMADYCHFLERRLTCSRTAAADAK